MSKFNDGDVVKLKSGGPKMTIKNASYKGKNDVQTNWFKDDEGPREGFFTEEQLELVLPPTDLLKNALEQAKQGIIEGEKQDVIAVVGKRHNRYEV